MNALPLLLTAAIGAGPQEVPLWLGKAPESVGAESANTPTVTIFPAPKDKANGTAVVVCPGGGYGFLASDHEGTQPAEWLNQRGVTALVLKYRIVGKDRPGPLGDAPMLDVQRAMRYARSLESTHGINPKRVGVWGFSAGGHLASTAATHFDAGKADAADPIDRLSCRPDFAILSYPVISMKPGVTHGGSRNNLLGARPDAGRVEFFNNDERVNKDTPPTFLFHTDEDKAVLPANSVLFYQAMKKHNVPGEMHIFEKGVHGVGLGTDPKWTHGNKTAGAWTERLEVWLRGRGLLAK